ncbi:MAG: hypothetical protein PWP23_716 [Candidatus Sumerlaeota bacterium]|nr:hypothetical protein [Candidatus Sumerlaeota bacterium]
MNPITRFFHRVLPAFVALFTWSLAGAAAPADYYQTITSQTGEALKLELRAIISGQRGYPVSALSYDGARDKLLESVDNVGGGKVRMLYSNDERPTGEWNVTINREHTWPQSYGAGVSPKKSDMHHLFLCDMSLNSSRSNDLYGDVGSIGPVTNYTGLPDDQNYSVGSTWQVSVNHRGDVARAILYMDVRYADLSLVSRGETPGANQMGYLDDLLLWHEQDPPDAFEAQRNDRVFVYQNNRNPFVDNPSWVGLVYGTATSSGPTLSNLTLTPPAPDDTSTVAISIDATDADGIASVTLYYRIGTSGAFTSMAMPLDSGSTFASAGAIPAQAEDTVVQYYVHAIDGVSDETFAPPSGANGPLSYTVRGDKPVLANLGTAPSTIAETDTVHIRADAEDDDGNSATNLTLTAYWRIAGTSSWTSIPMSPTTGTTWQTDTAIPAQSADTTVEYYVEAEDLGNALATIPANAPTAFSAYFVEEADPFITITDATDVEGKILISEFAHRVDGDASNEYVEIINVSNQGYLIDTLSLNDNDVDGDTGEGCVVFPTGAILPPGGIAVVYVRTSPTQAFLNTIPVYSNRNGAAVQVYAIDDAGGTLTFNGQAIPLMTSVGGAPQFAGSGDNIQLVYSTTETYTVDDVIDGVGYGTPSGPDDTVWGPGIAKKTDGASATTYNIQSATDGAYRATPTDTDTRADWTTFGTGEQTPGELPAAFELDAVGVVIASGGWNSGTSTLTVPEGGTETIALTLDSDPLGTVSVSVNWTGVGTANAAGFTIQSGQTVTFDSGNYTIPQNVVVAKSVDADTNADEAEFEFTGLRINPLSFTARENDSLVPVELDWAGVE